MKFYQVDPTKDARWAELIERHPKASVFHSVSWLEALQQTYGYKPMAFTTSPPTEALKNGILFCQVDSWLTGRRLVSLPFSDHCEPLCDSGDDVSSLMSYSQGALDRQACQYVEIRPISQEFGEAAAAMGFRPAGDYLLHVVDLRANMDDIFRSLDKDSVQRRVQRAERAGLVEKRGTSKDLLNAFYGLLVTTRGRHRVPPPPLAWFQNLVQCQGKALEIRVAYNDDSSDRRDSHAAIRDNGLLQVRVFGCAFQQVWCNTVALVESHRRGKIGRSARIRHGTDANSECGSSGVQEPLGCATQAIGLLEIPQYPFF